MTTPTESCAETWATPAEASSITGVQIFQSDLNTAQSIIDLFTDIHYGLKDELQPRTLRILKQAVSWQAKWQKEQGVEDFGTGTEKASETLGDYSYSNGSGGSGTGGSAEDSAMLAPIAQRWITKLRWKRTRTMDPLTPTERVLTGDGDLDGLFPWQPMGHGHEGGGY
ncbi:head-to-tail adaptor [Streptomyces phage Dryad]|nr:head-to-tail adaptor [Streptomyces phage Dryad]